MEENKKFKICFLVLINVFLSQPLPTRAMDWERLNKVAAAMKNISGQRVPPVVQVHTHQHQVHVALIAPSTSFSVHSATQPQRLNLEIEKFLRVHNDCRAELGVGPLVWDDGLAQYALQWAQELARTDSFRHRSHNRYGENLFWGSGAPFTLEHAARSWASEKPHMSGKQYTQGAGHYSQMIWKNTRRVGAAAVHYGNKVVIVANYDPAGNYIGQDAY